MLYCEKIENNKILNFTKDTEIANSLGWTATINEDNIEQAYDGIWYVKGYAPTKPIEVMQQEVRQVRNSYLEQYVDPKQLFLVWESLSQEDKQMYINYRNYLLDYTKEENWWEKNPKTLDEWRSINDTINDTISDTIKEENDVD